MGWTLQHFPLGLAQVLVTGHSAISGVVALAHWLSEVQAHDGLLYLAPSVPQVNHPEHDEKDQGESENQIHQFHFWIPLLSTGEATKPLSRCPQPDFGRRNTGRSTD